MKYLYLFITILLFSNIFVVLSNEVQNELLKQDQSTSIQQPPPDQEQQEQIQINSETSEIFRQPTSFKTVSVTPESLQPKLWKPLSAKRESNLLNNIDLNDPEKLVEIYGKPKLKTAVLIHQSSIASSNGKIMQVSTKPGSLKNGSKKFFGNLVKNLIDFTEEQIAIQWENRNLLKEVLDERSISPLYSTNSLVDLKDYNNSKIDLIWLRIPLPVVENHDFPLELYPKIESPNRINRYPLMAQEINAKHSLAKNIKKMSKLFSEEEFSFHPTTFVLPEDYDDLKQYSLDNKDQQFIMKPKFGGRGTGIHLYPNATNIPNDSNYVVQKYITNPFLINGKKFTCRLYVLVTSLDPLVIYIHNNGVIKFATTLFNIDKTTFNDEHMSMHITNQAVNSGKSSFEFSTDLNVDNIGSRWSLKAFWKYLDDNNIYSSKVLWERIKDTVIKSLFSVESTVLEKTKELLKSESSCFQLLGVDVDLLDNFQPIFIEANTNPQLGGSKAPFDNYNKLELIRETFDLIGDTVYNSDRMKDAIKDRLLEKRKSKQTQPTDDVGIMSNANIDPSNFQIIKPIDQTSINMLSQFEFEKIHQSNYELIYPTKETITSHSKYHLNANSKLNQLLRSYIISDGDEF